MPKQLESFPSPQNPLVAGPLNNRSFVPRLGGADRLNSLGSAAESWVEEVLRDDPDFVNWVETWIRDEGTVGRGSVDLDKLERLSSGSRLSGLRLSDPLSSDSMIDFDFTGNQDKGSNESRQELLAKIAALSNQGFLNTFQAYLVRDLVIQGDARIKKAILSFDTDGGASLSAYLRRLSCSTRHPAVAVPNSRMSDIPDLSLLVAPPGSSETVQRLSARDLNAMGSSQRTPMMDQFRGFSQASAVKRGRPESMDYTQSKPLSKMMNMRSPSQDIPTPPFLAIPPQRTKPTTARGPEEKGKRRPPRHWTKAEDERLKWAVKNFGEKNWKQIAKYIPTRTHVQCLQRWKKALDPKLVKGQWSEAEDQLLRELVQKYGFEWKLVAKSVNGRNTKQCRERWCNYLDPNIKKGGWSPEEDAIILEQQQRLGNKWSKIAKMLKGRTDNQVKIRHNSLRRKRQAQNNTNLYLMQLQEQQANKS